MQHLQWFDFLHPVLLGEIRDVALDQRAHFVPTDVVPPRADFRSSMVLYETQFHDLAIRFKHLVASHTPHFVTGLGLDVIPTNMELQMTRHGDGDFFRRHVDNGHGIPVDRAISFVYYFQLPEQPPFTGGELLLYYGMWFQITRRYGWLRMVTPFPKRLRPVHNSIVFFPSGLLHEVTTVHSGAHWADGRFSLNGWVNVAR